MLLCLEVYLLQKLGHLLSWYYTSDLWYQKICEHSFFFFSFWFRMCFRTLHLQASHKIARRLICSIVLSLRRNLSFPMWKPFEFVQWSRFIYMRYTANSNSFTLGKICISAEVFSSFYPNITFRDMKNQWPGGYFLILGKDITALNCLQRPKY